MQSQQRRAAFSLIEVLVAVGVFATAVATTLLLLPNLTKQSAESADFLTAQQLPAALRIELRRLAELKPTGFDELAQSLPEVSTPLGEGRQFVASRDGMRLHVLDQTPARGAVSPPEQYFLVECWKFTDEPLRPDSAKAHLVAYVRVSWPFRTGASANDTVTTALTDRGEFSFTCAITR